MSRTVIRTVRFAPYAKGHPLYATFTLRLLEGAHGQLCYRLTMREHGRTWVVFEGDDFRPGAGTAEDSDAAVRSLMVFLTLRPGDTDAEYFEGYNFIQRDFCDNHAEALSMAVFDRFGEG